MSYLSHSGANVPGSESLEFSMTPRSRTVDDGRMAHPANVTQLSIDEAVLVTLLKNTHLKHGGAKAPCLTFRIRERMFQGAKVPPMVLSLLGAKVRGNKSSSYLHMVTVGSKR